MTGISVIALDTLRARLTTTATVYVPGSDGYEESLVRWSDTGVKQAVSTTISEHFGFKHQGN